jgi:hypothetical protein
MTRLGGGVNPTSTCIFGGAAVGGGVLKAVFFFFNA